MGNNKNDEVERLVRLREQQIKARDPHAKQKQFQRRVAARQRRMKKHVTVQEMLQEVLTDVPHKWQGTIIGATIGIVILIVLTLVVEASWAELVGLVVVIVLALVGLVLGSAFDWRDEVRDL